MIALFRLLAAGLLLIILLLFSVSNTVQVPVGLFPFPDRVAMPLFVILFAGIFLGIALSALITGGDRLRRGWRLRRAQKRLAATQAELAALKKSSDDQFGARLMAIDHAQNSEGKLP